MYIQQSYLLSVVLLAKWLFIPHSEGKEQWRFSRLFRSLLANGDSGWTMWQAELMSLS